MGYAGGSGTRRKPRGKPGIHVGGLGGRRSCAT